MRAAVLSRMLDLGLVMEVLRYRKEQPARCGSETLVWQQILRALSMSDHGEECESWVRGWEERKGLEMWAMANYVHFRILPCPSRLGEAYSIAAECLKNLLHDGSAPYFARMLLEAALRTGDDVKFLEGFRAYPRYVSARAGNQPGGDDEESRLCQAFDLFAELLQAGSTDIADLARHFHRIMKKHDQRWVRVEWHRRIRSRLGTVPYMMLRLRLLFS
jgi:hypothetical protein